MGKEDLPAGQAQALNAREAILRVVRSSPGAHVREIERLSGYAYGAVEYHLHRLEEAGIVRVVQTGNMKAYFAAEFPRAQRPLAALVRREPIRRILVSLLTSPRLAHHELAEAAEMSPSTLTHHLKKLVAGGVVAQEGDSRHPLLVLADPAGVERALVLQAPALGDLALDAYIALWKEWRKPRAPPTDKAQAPGGP